MKLSWRRVTVIQDRALLTGWCHNVPRWSRAAGLTLCVATLIILMPGCDDDDESETAVVAIADTHDFGANNPDLIVAMGDSITTAHDAPPYPPMLASLLDLVVINEGISGEHAYEGVRRVAGVLALHSPGYLLVLYGANDLLHFAGADDIAEDLRVIVNAAQATGTIPILATMTPMARSHGVFDPHIRDVNVFIRAMAEEEGVLVVDLEEVFGNLDNDETPYVMEADDLLQWDGLHPNEMGNWEIALAFADMINFVRTGVAVD